jgi:hypothetical protein
MMAIGNEEYLNRFEGYGVQFDYPGFWELSEETDGDDVLLTVSADGSCFWALRVLKECPRAEEVVESCVKAFEDEYEDTEVQIVKGTLATMPAVCREVQFSCFELLNAVGLSSVRATDMSLLAWWQATDHELADVRDAFEQISQSVRILSLHG